MKVVLSISLVLFSVCFAYPQGEPTPAATAAQLRAHAQKILRETPCRVSSTIEMRDAEESPWSLYSSQTREQIGRDKWHLIQLTGPGYHRELIGIGDQTYEKISDGTWRLQGPVKAYTGPTIRSVGTPVVENSVNEKKDGGRTIETDGKATIQIIRTGEIVNNDRKMLEWYDESGRLTRVEIFHFNFERKKFQRNIEVYEYDPTIKIEAPIN